MPSRLMRFAMIALTAAALANSCGAATKPRKPAAKKPVQAAPVVRGLHVQNGVFLMDGEPYRGVGVNYVSAFTRVLANPEDKGYEKGFRELAQRGIPFVRVWIMGFWPSENKLYDDNRMEFYERLDKVVKCAEENKVGLIPSFFFNLSTVPDMMKEPVSEWGNPSSKTVKFMRQFVWEVIDRYSKSPVVWAWEFGNEMNLAADLPNAAEHRPAVVPQLGTPDKRTEKDEISHDVMRTAVRLFAEEVRKWDKSRPIVTGNTFPRSSAWHQKKEKSWTVDSEEQYAEMLVGDSPDPLDTLSGHLYAGEADRFGKKLTTQDYLNLVMKVSAQAKKPVLIGEFGVPGKSAKDAFADMLSAVDKSGVPLAAMWVYDFSSQDKDWNVTATNDRSYMLDEIGKLNRKWHGE